MVVNISTTISSMSDGSGNRSSGEPGGSVGIHAPAARLGAGELCVEFGDDLITVEDRLTFGRAGDLEIDSNPHLHRLVGEFVREHDAWWLRNLGTRLFITLVNPDGTRVDLAPGSSLVLVGLGGAVRVSAGPARYEIRFRSTIAAPLATPVVAVNGGATTEFEAFLTPREVDFLVTFAQPILDGTNGPLPTYVEVADVWGVAPKTLDNTLQTIKRKMRNARLVRDEPLDTLVRVAIAHSLVTRSDLNWSELASGGARSSAEGPRFSLVP